MSLYFQSSVPLRPALSTSPPFSSSSDEELALAQQQQQQQRSTIIRIGDGGRSETIRQGNSNSNNSSR